MQRDDLRAGVRGAAVAQPGPGRARREDAQLRLQPLRALVGQRREVVADDEGQQREAQAQRREHAQRARRAQPGGAQHGELRSLGQPGQREDHADQQGDRQQLVEVARGRQHAELQGLPGRVAAPRGTADLGDEVDEEEQREKGQRDVGHRTEDVAVEQPPHGTHGGDLQTARRRSRSGQTAERSRQAISASAPTSTAPCRPSSATPSPTRPAATQACISVIRL